MPGVQVLMAFLGVSVLLALSPGQDNLFVLMQSARHGYRVGLCVTLGLSLGVVGHTAAVAFGLAAVVAASPVLFTAIKGCGAVYMAYLAWSAWHGSINTLQIEAIHATRTPLTGRVALQWVGRGVLMNLSNPKVLIFFLAFLPQFTDPARGPLAIQVMVLGGVFILASLPIFAAISCCSAGLGAWIQRSVHAQRWLNRIVATVLGALAVRLATVQR